MSSGKVLQVIGPVVDVEFPLDEKLPEINDALKIKESDGKTLTTEVALVEFIVDVFYRLFIHAAAGIGHGNINFAVRPRLAQGNAAALRCELHRVGKQVRPHQFQ